MTTFAVPASPRVSTTPNVTRDSDGNSSVYTPFVPATYLEYDCLGERIEGWPQVQLGDVLGSEADLREHIEACQALLDHVDPTGVNRLPEGYRAVPAPLAAPALITRQVQRPAAAIAAELTETQARVLAALAVPGASFDDPDHGRTWDLGLSDEREAFTDADHTCVLALTDAGLLTGYRPTPLGCQVDSHLRQVAGLGDWDTAVAS